MKIHNNVLRAALFLALGLAALTVFLRTQSRKPKITGSACQKKAVVIGASSGIGRALACTLAREGYELGLVARRVELLEQLQKELPTKSYIQSIDVSDADNAMDLLATLFTTMGGCDLVIINAGVGYSDPELDWQLQKQMLAVNVVGFAAMAHAAFSCFRAQGRGHLVGITSVAAGLAGKVASVYSATKAFDCMLLAGLRRYAEAHKLAIDVTDIRPGFVDTDMVKTQKNKFWEISSEQAAEEIYGAIQQRDKEVYVSKRWRIIAWALKILPGWVLNKIG